MAEYWRHRGQHAMYWARRHGDAERVWPWLMMARNRAGLQAPSDRLWWDSVMSENRGMQLCVEPSLHRLAGVKGDGVIDGDWVDERGDCWLLSALTIMGAAIDRAGK